MKKFILITLFPPVWFLVGCASAGKDIYFRSRLPTQEVPLLHAKPGDGTMGVDLDLENSRFVSTTTNNLVNTYALSTYKADYNKNPGLDLSLTAHKMVGTVPVKFGGTLDFVELQVQPTPVEWNWFLNFNAGYYVTAAYTEDKSSGCFIFCNGQAEASMKEKEISTEQKGSETKVGGLLGYRHESMAFTFSYQWMNYRHVSEVSKTGQPTLSRTDSFFGYGVGAGVFYHGSPHAIIGITADDVKILWNAREKQETIIGLRTSFDFD